MARNTTMIYPYNQDECERTFDTARESLWDEEEAWDEFLWPDSNSWWDPSFDGCFYLDDEGESIEDNPEATYKYNFWDSPYPWEDEEAEMSNYVEPKRGRANSRKGTRPQSPKQRLYGRKAREMRRRDNTVQYRGYGCGITHDSEYYSDEIMRRHAICKREDWRWSLDEVIIWTEEFDPETYPGLKERRNAARYHALLSTFITKERLDITQPWENEEDEFDSAPLDYWEEDELLAQLWAEYEEFDSDDEEDEFDLYGDSDELYNLEDDTKPLSEEVEVVQEWVTRPSCLPKHL